MPESATNELDFVFASKDFAAEEGVTDYLAERVQVRTLNEVEDWGPRDHSRLEISVR